MTHALTEAEAGTKWCPFVRLTAENDRTYPMSNREKPLGKDGEVTRCIASDCMAWRWSYEPDGKSQSTTKGFCGLAGT